MNFFAELSLRDWSMVSVRLSSVLMITLQLAAPRVLAVMVRIPKAQVRLQVSALLSIELALYLILLNSFS